MQHLSVYLRKCVFLIGVAGILVSASQVVFAGEIDTLELEIDLVLGAPDNEAEYFFGSIGSVVEGSQGEIFVGDNRLKTVLKFSSHGELISRYEETGDGPGDLMFLFKMAVDTRGHIILAGQGGRVATLDTDFNYIESFDRPNPSGIAKSICVFPGGSVAIAAVNLGDHTTIDLLSPGYEHQLSFSDTYAVGTDVPLREETTYAGGNLAAAGTERLLFAQSAPYLVRVFSAAGKLLYETNEGGESFVLSPPKPEIHGDSYTVRFLGSTTGVAQVGKSDILVSAFRRDDDGETWGLLCLYDKDLHLLARREFDEVLTIAGLSSGGRVYLQQRQEDGTQLVRARVHRVKS